MAWLKPLLSRHVVSLLPHLCQGELVSYLVSGGGLTITSQPDVYSLLQYMYQAFSEVERSWSLWRSVAPGKGRDKNIRVKNCLEVFKLYYLSELSTWSFYVITALM